MTEFSWFSVKLSFSHHTGALTLTEGTYTGQSGPQVWPAGVLF